MFTPYHRMPCEISPGVNVNKYRKAIVLKATDISLWYGVYYSHFTIIHR